MKKIYKGAICTLLGMSLAACSDFLDVDPHNKISDEAVWGNLDYAETFLNNCYLYVEGENQNGVPAAIRMRFTIVPVMLRKSIHWAMCHVTITM